MKKYLSLFLLVLLSTAGMHAQSLLAGDMNDDGRISIGDVATIVETVAGRIPVRQIDAAPVDVHAIEGTWTNASKSFTFNADGGTNYPVSALGGEQELTYAYQAMQGNIVFFSDGMVVSFVNVVWVDDKMLVLYTPPTATMETFYRGIPANTISVSPGDINGKPGDTVQLTADVNSDAAIHSFLWETSDPAVATVSPTGLVTLVGEGTAVITVRPADTSGMYTTCDVSVKVPITSISLPEFDALVLGSTHTFVPVIQPSSVSPQSVVWISSNPSIISVDDYGTITALQEGSATITCQALDDASIFASRTIEVLTEVPVKEYAAWTSTNHADKSTSSHTYEIPHKEGTVLTLDWSVSSELNYDLLTITIDGEEVLRTSGDLSDSFYHVFTTNGTSTMVVAYTKDSSGSNGTDQCTISNIKTRDSGISTGGTVDGREYVDLGLLSGTLWATCNIGASTPDDLGDYFAWGENRGYFRGKTNFAVDTYLHYNGTSTSVSKYCTDANYGEVDGLDELEVRDDPARAAWGGKWRSPSNEQMMELRDATFCQWEWTTLNGVQGYRVTSKVNGASIFLPASGYRYDMEYDSAAYGFYWTRTLSSRNDRAYYLYFGSTFKQGGDYDRHLGFSIRAVMQ